MSTSLIALAFFPSSDVPPRTEHRLGGAVNCELIDESSFSDIKADAV